LLHNAERDLSATAKGVFIATQLKRRVELSCVAIDTTSDTTQLNSTDPVEQRIQPSQSYFCL